MTKIKVIEILHNLKKEVSVKYKAEIMGMFGSFARDEQNEKSDIDLLVDFHKGATLFDLSKLSSFLEAKLKTKVDIVSKNAVRKETKDSIFNDLVSI